MKNLPPINSLSYQPLWEQVYELLREAILTGKLAPGEQITEPGIANQLKVSRTPVREAMRMLELENLIINLPRRGAFVCGIKSKKEIDDIFQVRIILERLASELAAQKIRPEQVAKLKQQSEQIADCLAKNDLKRCVAIDTAFHQIIYEASENEYLQRFLDNLFDQITRFRMSSLADEGRMKEALIEHQELVAAIEVKDSKLAGEIAKKHIENAWTRVLKVFERQHEQAEKGSEA